MLPDLLTEGDNLDMPPMGDASFLLNPQLDEETGLGRKRRAGSRDINLQENLDNSQFLQNSIEYRPIIMDEELAYDPVDDLELDFGEDLEDPKGDASVEMGRDAPAPREAGDDLFSELDIRVRNKDVYDAGEGREPSIQLDFGDDDAMRIGDDDADMFNNIGDQTDLTAVPRAPELDRNRISESPLSDIDDAFAAEIEAEHQRNSDTTFNQTHAEESSVFRNPPQRRQRKLLELDSQTTISKTVINHLQSNHEKLLRPQSFLPRDPQLLALMEMQKNGGFVSIIMGEGRSSAWAPELRGLLSLDAVRKTNELKRKRDSGIADMDSDDAHASKSPRLDVGEDDITAGLGEVNLGRRDTIGPDETILEIGIDDDMPLPFDDDHQAGTRGLQEENAQSPQNAINFDDTTAPLVHPADSGPVSLGTKHAVHLLREKFGAEAADSPKKRKEASVVFQTLLPEATTSRVDATKMFFEVLVLATKDAVKVEQKEGPLGGPIKIRGKRGLWGDWAEREAGGEIAEEGEEEENAAAGPNTGLNAPSMAIAVGA